MKTKKVFKMEDNSPENPADILVIGAGHAGCEAAFAAARMGCKVILITSQKDTLGLMPCNPAVGGLAKSHLVAELDALGGEMGFNADLNGLQYRMLNASRGPAVRAVRVQCDKAAYTARLNRIAQELDHLVLHEGTVIDLLFADFPLPYPTELKPNSSMVHPEPVDPILPDPAELKCAPSSSSEGDNLTDKALKKLTEVSKKHVVGVLLSDRRKVYGRQIVLTSGTALGGRIWVGHQGRDGGGDGRPALALPDTLKKLSPQLHWRRLKTGTPPRLYNHSIQWEKIPRQEGETNSIPFFSRRMRLLQILPYTTQNVVYGDQKDVSLQVSENTKNMNLGIQMSDVPRGTLNSGEVSPIRLQGEYEKDVPSGTSSNDVVRYESQVCGLCKKLEDVFQYDSQVCVPRGTLGDLSSIVTPCEGLSFGEKGIFVNTSKWILMDGYATYRVLKTDEVIAAGDRIERVKEYDNDCVDGGSSGDLNCGNTGVSSELSVESERLEKNCVNDTSAGDLGCVDCVSSELSVGVEEYDCSGVQGIQLTITEEMVQALRSAQSEQLPCYLTHTTLESHQIIRDNLSESALYGGEISGEGVRYCPSIEDKIVKFGDRGGHHVILEPEGRDCPWCYPNGLSNSLPADVQAALIHSVPGLETATFAAPAYAIEYDCIDPRALDGRLALKDCPELFFAGQINGTTGYEEAAAQGFYAGVNAALAVQGRAPFILSRTEAYIGVMVDDLITKGTDEPYRMFTSRAEYRLLLRPGDAHLRLHTHAKRLGIVDATLLALTEAEQSWLEKTETAWRKDYLDGNGLSRWRLLAREGETYASVVAIQKASVKPPVEERAELATVCEKDASFNQPLIPEDWQEELALRAKYEGYIAHEAAQAEKLRRDEALVFPPGFDYSAVRGLRFEACEKLQKVQPDTLRRAGQIPGVNPADLMLLALHLKRLSGKTP